MDQLICMRSFMRVADLHSFSRAADALGLSRAVVSTHIADLERHLRCQLLHRTTRRVGLTTDGAEYLERCRRILAEIEAADEALRGTRLAPRGRLRVDVPVSFGRYLLTPALPRFQARYPDLQLEVQFNDRVIDIISEEIDVVVRGGPITEPHLIARRVLTTRSINCASPEYLREHGIPTHPDDLRRHKLIGHLPSSGSRRPHKWHFQRGEVRKQLTLPFSVAFNSTDALLMAAIRGAGILQIMDLMVAESLANGRLSAVLQEWTAPGADVSVVCRSGMRDSPKIRVFADFASELLLQHRRRVDALLELSP
ncbi:MAG TPA: LysR substrate-binding domain-containing protein [Steroidobacteraceae bacterium]|nr:LysR substrate-binding domain-containing protein [Steroidobacteraceae bacterium]